MSRFMAHGTAVGACTGARLSFRRLIVAAICLIGLSLLAACGGGGGGGSSPPPAIAITAPPADLHVVDGTAASFSVGVQGDAQLQWQRGFGTTWSDLPGATTASLDLGAVHVSDNGEQFRVRVTNRHAATNQLVSSVVTLTVDAVVTAPAISVQPQDAAKFDGMYVVFGVTATGTSLAYRWQRSDDGTTWTDVAQPTSPFLQFYVTLADDNARFRVVVSNSLGEVTSAPARLGVQRAVAPVFSLDPADTAVLVGQGATFTATAAGAPAPSIAWQTSVDGVNWTGVPDAATGSLVLSSTTSADNGKWIRAVANNYMGQVQSVRARLSVLASGVPVILAAPADTAVSTGMDATFTVDAAGVPSVSLQWQVSTDGGASFANVNGAVAKILTVPHLAAGDDDKRFRAVISNSAGSTTSTAARLHVIAPPTITLQPTYATWRPGVTDAMFTVAAGGSNLHYQWQASTDGGTTWSDVAGATGTSYVHAATAVAAVDAVRVVVSNPDGSATSGTTALTALSWSYVAPRPTGASLLGAAWVDATTVVASGGQGTIVRSTDAGASWQVVSESAWTVTTRGIAFDGQGHGVAPDGGTSGNVPVKRSVDGGLHWVEVWDWKTNPTSGPLSAAAWNNIGAFCLAGDNGVIHRSTDAGLSWQVAVTDGTTASLSALAFNADGVGLAVGDNGTIMRSVNGGANWARVATGGQGLRAVAYASRTTAFAGGDNGTLLRSDDGGQTWNPVASGVTNGITGLQFRDATTGALTLSQGSIRVTSDGGASWTLPAIASASDSLYAVSFGQGSKVVAVGEYGTIYRSGDDGLHWTGVAHGGWNENLNAVAFGSPTNGVAVGIGGRMTRSSDGGATWTAVSSGTTANLNAAGFFDASVGVALGDGGTIVRTTDAGATWAPVASGTTNQIVAVATASSTVGVASTPVGGLLRTSDAGSSWTPVASAAGTTVRGLAFRDALVGLAVGDAGTIQRTSDGGLTWTTVSSGGTQSLFAVTFAAPGVAVAVGQDGLLMRSTDGGVTWQPGPVLEYWKYGVTFVTPSLGFAVGDYGSVSVTHDGGVTWGTDYLQEVGGMTGISKVGSTAVVSVGFGGVITRDAAF